LRVRSGGRASAGLVGSGWCCRAEGNRTRGEPPSIFVCEADSAVGGRPQGGGARIGVTLTAEREVEPITGLLRSRHRTLKRTQPHSSGILRQQWRDEAALSSEYSGGLVRGGKGEKVV
jgi:hypothetical protein